VTAIADFEIAEGMLRAFIAFIKHISELRYDGVPSEQPGEKSHQIQPSMPSKAVYLIAEPELIELARCFFRSEYDCSMAENHEIAVTSPSAANGSNQLPMNST
jgi:hypothetical protein